MIQIRNDTCVIYFNATADRRVCQAFTSPSLGGPWRARVSTSFNWAGGSLQEASGLYGSGLTIAADYPLSRKCRKCHSERDAEDSMRQRMESHVLRRETGVASKRSVIIITRPCAGPQRAAQCCQQPSWTSSVCFALKVSPAWSRAGRMATLLHTLRKPLSLSSCTS